MSTFEEETEEEMMKDINWIRPLQTSKQIREHLNELYRGLENSYHKDVMQSIINEWELKYKYKKELEELKDKL